MNVKYQIFKQEKILIQQFIGFFSIDDYLKYTTYITSIPEVLPMNNILIDIRKMILQEDIEIFNEYIQDIVNVRNSFFQKDDVKNNMHRVFWVSTPLQTAAAQLFIDSFPHLPYSYYTSEANIKNALSIPEHLSNLTEVINNLENEYKP